ncbi:protein phosphatase 1 regulatory subunit 14C-like [Anneissia japonica]|uniref:protein phosphatase 1 regulatory subunit 14C-like n=1 Tax=Anneissia japonica TaxID=1529436 RepID=UPI001425751E|nr:protein phosphatase 1 regulatory subunit 14C-like [Anneissia japonica]
MAAINDSRVSFDGNGTPIITEDKSKKRNYNVTCKYNRKLMRLRLEIEEWMDGELRVIFDCEEGEDYDIEVDIDDVLLLEEAERFSFLKELLRNASKPTDDFIKELLERIKSL